MQISCAEKGRGLVSNRNLPVGFVRAARENGLNPRPTTDNRIIVGVSFSTTDAVSDGQERQRGKKKGQKKKKREQNAKTKALGRFRGSKLREMIYSQLRLPSVVLGFFFFISFSQLDQPRSFFNLARHLSRSFAPFFLFLSLVLYGYYLIFLSRCAQTPCHWHSMPWHSRAGSPQRPLCR